MSPLASCDPRARDESAALSQKQIHLSFGAIPGKGLFASLLGALCVSAARVFWL